MSEPQTVELADLIGKQVCGLRMEVNTNRKLGMPAEFVFRMVSPTGEGSLPYVTTSELGARLYRLCMGHSSLYEIQLKVDQFYLKKLKGDDRDPDTHDLSAPEVLLLQRAAVKLWNI